MRLPLPHIRCSSFVPNVVKFHSKLIDFVWLLTDKQPTVNDKFDYVFIYSYYNTYKYVYLTRP